jgi:predicted DNA-binding protein YlxM (UPF0122 family)
MSMVAADRRIGSAFFVFWGQYGQVSQFARGQGISRQAVYQQAKQVAQVLEGTQAQQRLDRFSAPRRLLLPRQA